MSKNPYEGMSRKDAFKLAAKSQAQALARNPRSFPSMLPFMQVLSLPKDNTLAKKDDKKGGEEEQKPVPTYNPKTGAFENMAAPASAAPALSQAAMEQPMFSQPSFVNRAMANPSMGTPASSIGWNPYPPTMNGNMYSPITMQTMPNTTQPQVGQLYNNINAYNPNDIMRYLAPQYRGGV